MKSDVLVVLVPMALAVCIIKQAAGLPTPRDNTLVGSDELPINQEAFEENKVKGDSTSAVIPGAETIPGRVWCRHSGEEPVEDNDCERHCIPKRYAYGLCIKNICSCV